MYIEDFFGLATEFMVYTTPASLCFVVLRMFVVNRRTPGDDMIRLRLNETSLTYSPAVDPGAPAWLIVVYLLTSLATFSAGVLAFEVVHAFS